MLLDTNQNLISSFNANTDLSILTLSPGGDQYAFNVDLFNVRATIKLNQSILDSLTTVDLNNEKVYPVLKTQCIFQNQSTFNSKFENEIFSKTSNLNSYTPDANIYIEKFPQYAILNKYYKSNQTSNHTNIENETIVSTQNVDFNRNSETGNGLGYYDPDTYEYTHVINTTDSKLFLNLDYVSVRILILDNKDNIIGDSLNQINTKSILDLASQRITVDEMLFIKENFVDNIESFINFSVVNTDNPNLYNLKIEADDFGNISNTFDIEINGIIRYINDFSTNAFPFSLTYFENSFQSETVDDAETDSDEDFGVPTFTVGQEFEFNDATIQDFHKSLAQHLFLSGETEIKYEITGRLRFLRKEDQSGTRRLSDLSWSFTKEEDMTSLLSNNIFSSDDDSIATFAINNIFNNIQITNKISKNAEDGDFFLEVKAASQIPEIEVSGNRKTFKERTILERILIDTRSVSDGLFPSLQRLGNSAYFLGDVDHDEFVSGDKNLLSLEKLFDEQSIFFSESDNSVLEGSDYINRITFTYSHYYNNQKFSLDYIVNNKNDKSTTFLDRINNYNQIFEEQNVVNLNFENLIKIAIDINNNNQDSRPAFQNGRLPITGSTQFQIERQRETTFAEEYRESRINCFKVEDFAIDRARFNSEILEDYVYLGYVDPEDLYNNIYVLLSANSQLTVRKFSEVFGSYSNTNSGYYKLQNNFFRNLDVDVASSKLFISPLRSFTSYLDIGPNQNSKKTIKDLILSDQMPEVKRGLRALESKVYNLKLNIFVFPKVINDLLDGGLAIGSEGELTLFPDKAGEELDTATSAAHSFINTISLNRPEEEHFRQLFTSERTNSNIEYYRFIKSFLPNVFDISRPTIRFSFRQGSSESQLTAINNKSSFLSIEPNTLTVVSATESDVSVSESTRIQINELESEGNYLDETNNPAEDLLINTENLRMDLVPEYRVYEDFYNLQKVNTEIFIEKNPFNVSFEGAVDIGNRSSEIKTQKVNKVIIYNEISSESKIKIDITALKRSFDIYGNIAESDIFVRASLFPLFTTPSDFLSHYRATNLRSADSSTSYEHSWYSKKYKIVSNSELIDYFGDTTDRNGKTPVSSSLTNYEGKKYFSYQRFYSKDHTGEIGQDNIKFGFVENYIPQSYIVQERILSRDYLTIDINSNSVNLLDSLDFSDLASDAIGVFVKDECMLKDIVLRISVSIKVFGGSIPQYTTLYLNSIVSRQNLLNDKIIFNNNSTGTGRNSAGPSAVPVTEIVTRQIRRDY